MRGTIEAWSPVFTRESATMSGARLTRDEGGADELRVAVASAVPQLRLRLAGSWGLVRGVLPPSFDVAFPGRETSPQFYLLSAHSRWSNRERSVAVAQLSAPNRESGRSSS